MESLVKFQHLAYYTRAFHIYPPFIMGHARAPRLCALDLALKLVAHEGRGQQNDGKRRLHQKVQKNQGTCKHRVENADIDQSSDEGNTPGALLERHLSELLNPSRCPEGMSGFCKFEPLEP